MRPQNKTNLPFKFTHQEEKNNLIWAAWLHRSRAAVANEQREEKHSLRLQMFIPFPEMLSVQMESTFQ